MRTIVAIITVIAFALITIFPGVSMARYDEPRTVKYVDLERYLGTWFEISRYENSFQRNCVASTANYSLTEDGDIRVLNSCRIGSLTGSMKTAEGKAWVVDTESNAKLKVQFFWPFRGDYWIVDLGDDYEYAVVSDSKRKYLWVLSRMPKLSDVVYEGIIDRLEENGFDTTRLIMTPQYDRLFDRNF